MDEWAMLATGIVSIIAAIGGPRVYRVLRPSPEPESPAGREKLVKVIERQTEATEQTNQLLADLVTQTVLANELTREGNKRIEDIWEKVKA